MSGSYLRTAGALLRADIRNVIRDSMLMIGIVMSILPAVLLAFFSGVAEAAGRDAFGYEGTSRVLGTIAVLMPGSMLGWVIGFLLIEDRDEGMLTALEVTPLGKGGMVAWRLGICAAIIFVLSLLTALVTLPAIGKSEALGMAILGACYGLLVALFLLAFARNKVEAMALTKLANLSLLAPLLALLPTPLRYVGAPLPPFWVGEMAGLGAGDVSPIFAFVVGAGSFVLLAVLMWRRLGQRIG